MLEKLPRPGLANFLPTGFLCFLSLSGTLIPSSTWRGFDHLRLAGLLQYRRRVQSYWNEWGCIILLLFSRTKWLRATHVRLQFNGSWLRATQIPLRRWKSRSWPQYLRSADFQARLPDMGKRSGRACKVYSGPFQVSSVFARLFFSTPPVYNKWLPTNQNFPVSLPKLGGNPFCMSVLSPKWSNGQE